MKRTRSPSGNGPDTPSHRENTQNIKATAENYRPSIKTQVVPLNLCLFQQHA